MHDPFKLTSKNNPRPSGADWFARDVKRIGDDFSIPLRLRWMPDVEGFLWGQTRKLYAAHKCRRHTGWAQGRYDEHQILHALRRFGPKAFPSLNPDAAHMLDDGTWIVPQWDYWEVAWPRFVVEKLIDEEMERPFHEAERFEFDHETGELIDVLGPYPKEGLWKCLYVICQHWVQCCKEANEQYRLCYGVGRLPIESDIVDLRKAVQEHLSLAAAGPRGSESWQRAMAQMQRDYRTRKQKANEQMLEQYKDIFKDAIAPTLAARLTPSVFLDSSKRLLTGD